MKYTHFASSKSSKISQKQLKKHERHKLGKKKASEADFWRFLMIFGVPRGSQKCTKIEKCLPKIDRKKGGKKGGDADSPGRGSAAIARPVGMQDSCSGRFLPWFLTLVYTRHHSRRSAADSFRSRDPRRPLRLKVSKLLFHIIDQHKNIMLREREHKTLQMRSENPSGISSANLVFKWHASCAWKMIGGNLVNHCPLW